jgi:hypothetical protein
MSLLGKLTKFGLAKRALDEVRKPENQERIRRMAASVANRTKKRQERTPEAPTGLATEMGAPDAGTPLSSATPSTKVAGAPAEETPAAGS